MKIKAQGDWQTHCPKITLIPSHVLALTYSNPSLKGISLAFYLIDVCHS